MTIDTNISFPILFMFWLLIIIVGYFIVEIVDWEKYIFRQSLEKYNNSLFNRIIHYVIRGLVANLLIIIVEALLWWGKLMLIELFNNSWIISSNIIWEGIDRIGMQIIIFSLFYFLYLIILIALFYLMNWFWQLVFWNRWNKNKELKSIELNKQNKINEKEKTLPEKEEKEIKKNILIGIISWLIVSISFLAWDLITELLKSLWLQRWWVVGVFVIFLVLVILTNYLMKKKL